MELERMKDPKVYELLETLLADVNRLRGAVIELATKCPEAEELLEKIRLKAGDIEVAVNDLGNYVKAHGHSDSH